MWGWVKRASFAILMVSLVACGGGGDATSVSSSASALNFQGYVGESIASQSISIKLKEAPGTVYVDYGADNPSIAGVNGYLTGERSGVLEVRPGYFPSVGTYKTRVYLNLYSDPAGLTLLASYAYDITVVVDKGLEVAPGTLSLNAAQGATAKATLALSGLAGASGVSFSATRPQEEVLPPAWLRVVFEGRNVEVTASAEGLPPGNYSTQLIIRADRGTLGTSYVTVPINFTVGPGLLAPARQTLLFNINSTQSSLASSVPVTRGDGASLAWSATTTAPWLALSALSGVSPANLGFAVNLEQAKSLTPFADHTATIVLSSPVSVPVEYQVVLQQRVPYVSFAGPYGIPVGTTTRVILGGKGFSQMTAPASSLQFSGLNVGQIQVVSDTQISVNVTPSSAGNYSLSVVNSAGWISTQASLAVARTHTYAPAILTHEVQKSRFVHDPVRKAVFSLAQDKNAVYKFSLVDGAWRTDEIAINSPASLTLSPDGRSLWVFSDTLYSDQLMIEIDPDVLSVRASYATGVQNSNFKLSTLPVTSNNRMWLYGGDYFDLELRTRGRNDALVPQSLDFGTLFGSADGSLAVFGPSLNGSTIPPAYIYDPARNEVGPSSGGLELGRNASVSTDGSRILGDWGVVRVFDRSFNVIGQLPAAPSSEFWGDVALTPDGKKILVVRQQSSGIGVPLSIDVYSTQSLRAGTTEFERSARIPLTTDVRWCDPAAFSCSYGATKLLPARDSSTVFWFGNKSMMVIPLP